MENNVKEWVQTTHPDTGQRTVFAPRTNNMEDTMVQIVAAIDFCLEEFEEKHGDTKTPEIVLINEAGKITVRAENY